METKQLEHFVQVANSGSFTHAAVILGVYQPALSKRIKDMEEELRVPLFHRTGRGVVLTDAGKILFERALVIIDQIKQARSEIGGINLGQIDKAVIAFPPSIGRFLTVPLTRTLQAAFPGIQIQFAEAFSSTLLEWLNAGRVDVAVLYDSFAAQRLNAEAVVTERMSLIGNNSLGHPIGIADLSNLPLVLPSARHGLRRLVDSATAAEGIKLHVVVEADALSSLLELVRAGFGYTILPETTVLEEIANEVLEVTPFLGRAIERKLVLATAGSRRPIPALGRLMNVIRREMSIRYSEYSPVALQSIVTPNSLGPYTTKPLELLEQRCP